jgi:hypothetical protein
MKKKFSPAIILRHKHTTCHTENYVTREKNSKKDQDIHIYTRKCHKVINVYSYLKQTKMFFFFFFSQKWRTGGRTAPF